MRTPFGPHLYKHCHSSLQASFLSYWTVNLRIILPSEQTLITTKTYCRSRWGLQCTALRKVQVFQAGLH